jgi:WD40 repeat protein
MFSPDGHRFVALAGSRRNAGTLIQLLDTAAGRLQSIATTKAPGVLDLGFTADGQALWAVLGNPTVPGEVVIWDVGTCQERSRRAISVPSGLWNWPWAFTTDGRLMATVGRKGPVSTGDVLLWDLPTDQEWAVLTDPSHRATALGFMPDGATLAIGREDGTIELWELAARRVRATLHGHSEGYYPQTLRFSADGSILVAESHYRPTNVLGQLQGQLRFALSRMNPGRPRFNLVEVVVWNIATGKRLGSIPQAILPHLSSDGRLLATCHDTPKLELRDVPKPSTVGTSP